MSNVQAYLTGSGVAVAMSAIVAMVSPQPPIVVNSLTYENGFIIQDRDITTGGPWRAEWTAKIISAVDGSTIPGCEGTGNWSYPPGHLSVAIPLQEWVGNNGCMLLPGDYVPFAKYEAGEDLVLFRGEQFRVE